MEVLTRLDAGEIGRLRAAGTFFWLDLLDPPDDALERLADVLDLHPAAVEDSREWDQLPRLDEYGDHVLLVFFSARSVDERVEPVEVHVYVSGNWIVTVRRCETGLDSQREWLTTKDCEEDQVLYHVLDALADGWDPVIDELDRRVDKIEHVVIEQPQQQHLRSIYRLKQEVGELQRRAGPQRAAFVPALETILRLPGLVKGERGWLRDVDAHLDSIASDLRRISGDLSALSDTFFNASANRLNRLATLVAVASVFFLVWTLVTGFFGQNFGWLVDNIDTKRDFIVYELGALVVPTIVLVVILWRRRNDWWK